MLISMQTKIFKYDQIKCDNLTLVKLILSLGSMRPGGQVPGASGPVCITGIGFQSRPLAGILTIASTGSLQ